MTRTSITILQFLTNLRRHAVFLYLTIAIMHHTHLTTAGLGQRSIEFGKIRAAIHHRIDMYRRYHYWCRFWLRSNSIYGRHSIGHHIFWKLN